MTEPTAPPSLPPSSQPHVAFLSAPDESCAGSRLTIDLRALAENYKLMAEKSGPATCAGVIKADAYGTGMEQAARTLWLSGCRIFFVALPREGERARAILPNATIYILNGLVGDDSRQCADFYRTHNLRPVLGSMEELDLWLGFCDSINEALPYALHFDTGMNRLGMSLQEATALAETWVSSPPFSKPNLVMSHLACADEPQHPLNSKQLDQFRTITKLFPGIPASLANSAGISLGPDYHFDLVRPGIALYGGCATGNHPNPMKPVATLEGRILSTRHVPKGQSVSYGATEVTKRQSRLATLCMGYADGYLRAAGSSDERKGAKVWIDGYEAPVIGRVTMDLLIIDVTNVPETHIRRGAWAELFGPNIPIDDVASDAGTIDYELLTSLGLRAFRRYV